MASKSQSNFHDFLPLMAEKLGGDGLIGELCHGFQLLMDSDKGVITFESLKRNSTLLGLQDLNDEDLRSMLEEGDFDGDGALNQMEFCVLMFRLSPELMEQFQFLSEEALQQEFNDHDFVLKFDLLSPKAPRIVSSALTSYLELFRGLLATIGFRVVNHLSFF